MAWTLEFDPRAQRELAKLDAPVRQRILRFLQDVVLRIGNRREVYR